MLYKTHRNNVIDWWRRNITKPLTPLFMSFEELRVNPNHLTIIGLLFGLWSTYFFYTGDHLLFSILIMMHILFDVLDGNYARYLGSIWRERGKYLDFYVDSGLVVVILVLTFITNKISNDLLISASLILFIIHHVWYLLSELESPWAPSRTWLFMCFVLSLFNIGIWAVIIFSSFGITMQALEFIKDIY